MKYRDIITFAVALLVVLSIPYGIGVANIPFLFVIPLILLIVVWFYLFK